MMRLLLTLSLLSPGSVAFAQTDLQNFRPSPAEMRQLPDYCSVKFNSKMDSPEWEMWRKQLGSNYIDIHHFCAGLNFLNRYYVAQSKADKSGMLVAAKRNFEYMARAAHPDFPLRADIYLHRGITYKLMGRQGPAVSDFQQALSLNPKLTKAYLELISIYAGNKKKALETTVAGLKQVPDAKSLQRRYLELGGKLPYPQPDPTPPLAEIPKTVNPESTPTSPEVKADPATPGAADPAALVNPPTESKPGEPAKPATPAIGSPTNPYCRFCP